MSEKNASVTWFYNDWENDKELKSCTLAAQGLWMRLLCVAAASPERGIVQIGSLNFSHPEGLPQIAAAVGRSPEEIAPLIDELVSSGAASLDRKRRIFNRRMVRAAALSQKRSESGKLGAGATHGKERRIEPLPRQNPGNRAGKPPPSSSLQSPDLLSHGKTIGDAPSAPAPEGARSGASGLTTDAEWQQRVEGYDPSSIRKTWKPAWGPTPDSPATSKLIPAHLVQWWKAKGDRQRTDA